MEENSEITIMQVGNGFVVRPFYDYQQNGSVAANNKEIQVFRSMNELNRFMQDHFDHRGIALESDQ